MNNFLQRITSNPAMFGGKPTVRGMRIKVTDVLDLLSNGLSVQQILKEELPDLEEQDIIACLKYASLKLNYPVLHVAV